MRDKESVCVSGLGMVIRLIVYGNIFFQNNSNIRRGKFSTNLSPSGRIRQVQNTTSCHDSGTMNSNSIRISTVLGHAPYKYPPP